MSFLTTIESIGKDILKGIEVAAPIIGEFVPKLAPILTEVAQIIESLEAGGKAVSADQMSGIVQGVSMSNALRQHASSKAA